jgi:hypothetical protein
MLTAAGLNGKSTTYLTSSEWHLGLVTRAIGVRMLQQLLLYRVLSRDTSRVYSDKLSEASTIDALSTNWWDGTRCMFGSGTIQRLFVNVRAAMSEGGVWRQSMEGCDCLMEGCWCQVSASLWMKAGRATWAGRLKRGDSLSKTAGSPSSIPFLVEEMLARSGSVWQAVATGVWPSGMAGSGKGPW